MSEPQTSTIVGGVTGTAGLTFPLWNEFVAYATGVNQLLIAVLGLAVLVLTARKLLRENQRLDRERKRDLKSGGE